MTTIKKKKYQVVIWLSDEERKKRNHALQQIEYFTNCRKAVTFAKNNLGLVDWRKSIYIGKIYFLNGNKQAITTTKGIFRTTKEYGLNTPVNRDGKILSRKLDRVNK
jgi:hypothetical protein